MPKAIYATPFYPTPMSVMIATNFASSSFQSLNISMQFANCSAVCCSSTFFFPNVRFRRTHSLSIK